MPFIKKNNNYRAMTPIPARPMFIGRINELLFFTEHILKPEEPLYNILSIWGQGGVGKTTLLHQLKRQAEADDYRAYCLTAWIDERQVTPARMMRKFAQQLPFSATFEKALSRYEEALQMSLPIQVVPSLQQKAITKTPDLAGAIVEGVPVVGPILREGIKATTEYALDQYQTTQARSKGADISHPLERLTHVFLTELNHLAATKVSLPSTRTKREQRIILLFDTFEQVADEAVSWLLSSVLEHDIDPNIVFVIAGRDPLERSTADGLKFWLPYYEAHTLYALPLETFSQEETFAYLAGRGVNEKKQTEALWHLSHGLPLYLSLLTSFPLQETIDPTQDVVNNFLNRIPHSEQIKRRLALDGALFSRPFNLDDLEAFPYLTDQDRPSLYDWLLRQPFVHASSLNGRYIYHDLIQELFPRYLFLTSPKAYFVTRKTLAEYYQQSLTFIEAVQGKNIMYASDERLEVVLALVSQLFFLPDEENHIQALLPVLGIINSEDREKNQVIIRKLYALLQASSPSKMSLHAHQTIQALVLFCETLPTEINKLFFDQTQVQKWSQVIDTLLRLILYSPSSSSSLLALFYHLCGWGYHHLKNYQKAVTYHERALKACPSEVHGHLGLGYTYYRLKDYHRAIEHFNQGLQLAPFLPDLYLGRGRAYGRIQAYQQALSDLEHSLHLEKRNLGAYNNRSRIYMEMREYQKALTDLNCILEIDAEHPLRGNIQFWRGCILLRFNDLPKAYICFNESYEMKSVSNLSLWAREWCAMCQNSPTPQTIQHLEAIASGEDYTAYTCRGVIHFLYKNYERALADLQQASTLQYDADWQYFGREYWREWDAPFWEGMVYAALDQGEEARNALEKALALEMPPILLKPLRWFEIEKTKLYEASIQPLLHAYHM